VVSGNTETSPRVIDLLLKALAAAVPERVIGQSHCAACTGIFAGEDPNEERSRSLRRKYVSMIDVHAGGMGARPDKDGINAIRVHVGNTGAQPVELIERQYPLTIEEWTIVPDSGGAGRWRGGCTTRRAYRIHYEEATATVIAERGRVAPEGVFGGKAGALFQCRIDRADGGVEMLPAKGEQAVLGAGDRIAIQPAGSGGYGDPLERPVERVLADVLDGYVSPAAAEAEYGIVVRDGAVDALATQRRLGDKAR
jgi:N-methylhydantoinase B